MNINLPKLLADLAPLPNILPYNTSPKPPMQNESFQFFIVTASVFVIISIIVAIYLIKNRNSK
jgi:hypothetical protein